MRTIAGVWVLWMGSLPVSPVCAEAIDLGVACTLSGQLRDMSQLTNRAGYTFRVAMRGLHYQGRLDRTIVEETGPDRFTIWLALRDFQVTIDRTEISGRPGRASCGPMQITLGSQRDLWLAFDVALRVEDQRPTLVLLATRFRLPPDNWRIQSPEWVRTSGIGMSRGQVVNGLRKGLAENRKRVAERMIKAAPEMLAEVVALSGQLPPLATEPSLPVPSRSALRDALSANEPSAARRRRSRQP